MCRLGGSTTPWECEWEHKFSQRSEWVDLVVVRHHGSVSGSTRIGVGVSDDLVVVRHHGSVSGSTRIGVGVSDDLVVVRHHGSGNRHSLRTQVM